MATKIKVYELAKELGSTPERVMDIGKRLGVSAKSPMAYLGSVEAQNVRDFFKKNVNREKTVVTKSGGTVTEKRVGAKVIRRKATQVDAAPEPAPEIEVPQEPVQEAPPEPAPQETAAPEPEATPVRKTRRVAEPIVKRSKVEPVAPPPPKKVAAPPVQASAAEASEKQAAEPVVEEKPVQPVAPAQPPGRRLISSIIKRTKTEDHLGEKIGPRPEKRPPRVARMQEVEPGPAGQERPAASSRVKEVAVPPQAAGGTAEDAAATKRRMMQRQDTVFRSADFLKRELVHSMRKKKSGLSRPAMKTQITQAAEHKRTVTMGETISVGELAKALGVKANKILEKTLGLGLDVTINSSIDKDTVELIANDYHFTVKQEVFREEDYIPQAAETDSREQVPRAPVVTVMGHVDHGKTSLLDRIRNTAVVDGEAGGITQHIGAYTVTLPKGKITFIDTPGHAAFTAMRARGAQVTDIVILVVAATEGPMPQTLESISHAKAAGVPIVVAMNKIDLPDANPDKTKQVLAGHDLNPEEWGGDTIYVPVSAKTGKGIDQLLESVLLQAELAELKAPNTGDATGTIIESRLDKGRGPVVTCLIQTGQLKVGDSVVVGETFGKVRAITDFTGKQIKTAGPSDAVEILGLSEVPGVGDPLYATDEKNAREVAQQREAKRRSELSGATKAKTLEEIMAAPSTAKEFRCILKADVQGSVEAVKGALLNLPKEKVEVKILHVGCGAISESDVNLAVASDAHLLGFNVRPDSKASRLAEDKGVKVMTYRIIYELLDEVKKSMEGLMDAKVEQKVIGRAQVRDIFTVPKIGTIAGSAVTDGKITRTAFLRLVRDGRVVYEGKVSSLRRFKDDVKEVNQGYECGIGLENFNDIKQGDELEAFIKEEIRDTL